jgi:hypothetical protein
MSNFKSKPGIESERRSQFKHGNHENERQARMRMAEAEPFRSGAWNPGLGLLVSSLPMIAQTKPARIALATRLGGPDFIRAVSCFGVAQLEEPLGLGSGHRHGG